jgi:hypothetical protein
MENKNQKISGLIVVIFLLLINDLFMFSASYNGSLKTFGLLLSLIPIGFFLLKIANTTSEE